MRSHRALLSWAYGTHSQSPADSLDTRPSSHTPARLSTLWPSAAPLEVTLSTLAIRLLRQAPSLAMLVKHAEAPQLVSKRCTSNRHTQCIPLSVTIALEPYRYRGDELAVLPKVARECATRISRFCNSNPVNYGCNTPPRRQLIFCVIFFLPAFFGFDFCAHLRHPPRLTFTLLLVLCTFAKSCAPRTCLFGRASEQR